MPSWRFVAVLALLIAGLVLAGLGGADSRVSLASALGMWTDTLRDADHVGMRLTRMRDTDEMRIGGDLAQSILRSAPEDAGETAYVTDVAQSLLPFVRRKGIRYQFHVITSVDVNAFALPGGHVFVTSGLMGFLETEAELVAVLGHEISHVDLRHCVERYQYGAALRKVGVPGELGWLVEMTHQLATVGFSKDQESEADGQGERWTVAAGYDPGAAVALFLRMQKHFGETPAPRAATPVGEIAHATFETLGSYFQTHPASEERARKMREMAGQAQRRSPGKFYIGRENFRRRIARSKREFPGE